MFFCALESRQSYKHARGGSRCSTVMCLHLKWITQSKSFQVAVGGGAERRVAKSCLHFFGVAARHKMDEHQQSAMMYMVPYTIWGEGVIAVYNFDFPPLPLPFIIFPFRPSLRHRRDIFGEANSTFLHALLGDSGSLGEVNSSAPEPRTREFHERKVEETSVEIQGLKPFTVYRIDLHACNEEIQQCSAPAFSFPRTEPAGERNVNTTS